MQPSTSAFPDLQWRDPPDLTLPENNIPGGLGGLTVTENIERSMRVLSQLLDLLEGSPSQKADVLVTLWINLTMTLAQSRRLDNLITEILPKALRPSFVADLPSLRLLVNLLKEAFDEHDARAMHP